MEQLVDKPEKVKGPASYFPSIERKYGQPVEHWQNLIRQRSELKHMEIVSWLKTEHGLGHGHANALVAHCLAKKPK
ncbi:MAG: DUF4287 domain-containing protein [Rhodoferax sp.]|nr:DUF4287 domain-containing protein [Rhodoferax sp.]